MTTWSVAGLAVACAALTWPGTTVRVDRARRAGGRSGRLGTRDGPGRLARLARPGLAARPPSNQGSRGPGLLLVGAVTVMVGLISGGAAAGACAMALSTGLLLRRGARASRRAARERAEILAGLRLFGNELRSGATPLAAAGLAAGAARGAGAALLREVASPAAVPASRDTAGLDGADPRRPADSSVVGAHRRRVHAVWSISAEHGVPWGSLLEGLVQEAEAGSAADDERAAHVAGPRLSGYVLAALPALGVLLGVGMGADPLGVLFGTAVGGVLLVVGTALTCAGLLWSARITR